MSTSKIPICNGGFETFGLEGGSYQFVGRVRGRDTNRSPSEGEFHYSDIWQDADKGALTALLKEAEALHATHIINVRETITDRTRGHTGQVSTLTITGDAVRFTREQED